MAGPHQLVIVANRLPVRKVKSSAQKTEWESSPGGLVSALFPYLQKAKGTWVGWAGTAGAAPDPFRHKGVAQRPVPLSSSELDDFYSGFCNGTIWPLYHATGNAQFHRHWWRPYLEVNQRYADATLKRLKTGDTLWVQDYQLQLVPKLVRKKRKDVKIGFFLHIPFPPVELFSQLPWRNQILEGILGADLVGFQTSLAAQNFLRAVKELLGLRVSEKVVHFNGRMVRVKNFPISIDVDRYGGGAAKPEVIAKAEVIRKRFGPDRKIILGVDRLDYTKGVDRRLKAIETILSNERVELKDFVFVQILVPSREKIPQYIEMRNHIEGLVGHINGDYGDGSYTPIQYFHRNVSFDELIAYYLAADVMLVTPLADGMNLVCKEYVACRRDNTGVLVLSEFAGAGQELKDALLVNPHDVDGLSAALETALKLPADEIQKRMKKMRRVVSKRDVYQWAEDFLETLRA